MPTQRTLHSTALYVVILTTFALKWQLFSKISTRETRKKNLCENIRITFSGISARSSTPLRTLRTRRTHACQSLPSRRECRLSIYGRADLIITDYLFALLQSITRKRRSSGCRLQDFSFALVLSVTRLSRFWRAGDLASRWGEGWISLARSRYMHPIGISYAFSHFCSRMWIRREKRENRVEFLSRKSRIILSQSPNFYFKSVKLKFVGTKIETQLWSFLKWNGQKIIRQLNINKY